MVTLAKVTTGSPSTSSGLTVTVVTVTTRIFPTTTAVAVSLIELLLSATRFPMPALWFDRKCFHVGAGEIGGGETVVLYRRINVCFGHVSNVRVSPSHLIPDVDL